MAALRDVDELLWKEFQAKSKRPFIAFIVSLWLFAFFLGIIVKRNDWFPMPAIRAAWKTFKVLIDKDVSRAGEFRGFSDIALSDIQKNRVISFEGNPDSMRYLSFGGLYQYMEYCPGYGCLAVQFSRSGSVERVIPYRPDEIFLANRTPNYLYEENDFKFTRDAAPVGMKLMSNGDLLVIFQSNGHVFPFANGIARVDSKGYPVWYRRDYSHHWLTTLPDGRILVPALQISNYPITVSFGKNYSLPVLSANSMMDTIHILDAQGNLLREIPVLQALIDSPFRIVLQHSSSLGNDPIHLNYVDMVNESLAAAVPSLDVGDFMVSLRNISAFGFIDGRSGQFKKLVRGNFYKQHSVQSYGSKILMFDNQGGHPDEGLSRLLMVDMANGTEKTLFPRPDTASVYQIFSEAAGNITISPQQDKVIVTSTMEGKSYEVRLEDGKVLTLFNNIHDASSIHSLPNERYAKAAIFSVFGLQYISNNINKNIKDH
ncbi:MAG: arylsulfotransferase family protein [Magnetococcus sp. YQC-5]